jgi:hypothetical protein
MVMPRELLDDEGRIGIHGPGHVLNVGRGSHRHAIVEWFILAHVL